SALLEEVEQIELEPEATEEPAEEETAPAMASDGLTDGQREASEIMAQFAKPEPAKPEAPEPEVEEAAPEMVEPTAELVAASTGPLEEGPVPYLMGEEDSGIPDEEEDVFAPLSEQGPPTPAPLIDEGPTDPLAEKLSAIANEVTLMESQMQDKKAVSDVMLAFEGIQVEIAQRQSSLEMAAVADALAALYEKILMEGVSDNKKAVDFTINGVMILSAYLENPSILEKLTDQAETLMLNLKESFNVESVRMTGLLPATAGIKADTSELDENEALKSPRFLGYESIQMSTSEDLLIYSEFVSEVSDAASHIETDLLELEASPEDMELINDLFRAYHSIKGAAGFLGVNTVNILCHEAESLLDKFRKRIMVSDQASVDLLLKAIDFIKVVNDGLSDSCEKAKMNMPGAFLEIPRLDVALLAQALRDAAIAESRESPVEEERKETPFEASEIEDTEEAQEAEESRVALLGQILMDEGKVTEEDVELALRAQSEKRPLGEILLEMGVVDQPALEQALVDQLDRKKKVKSASLKIDTEKLDSLLEMVGELVISQSIVSQEAEHLMTQHTRLVKNIQSLGKITKGIQDQVMTLRMVQLKQTFQKMSRLVRDLSKKMKKPVLLHLNGEETEIDKTIIEELNDPLVHLLRNAMDHGIETPEERAAMNKPATGNIWLNAYHRGGNVYIEVIDDGRGIDKERIKRKAVEKGLVEEDVDISDQEIHELVIMPGFSTHDTATEISGRGVGMDVVRSNIDALGGRLDISSKAGEGSEFTVRLPLTMAIVDGMIVQIGGDRFVIPTISIRESIRPKRDEVSTFKKSGEMVDVRGKLLPLVRLRKFLGIQNGDSINPWEGLVIIVESDEKEYGFMVDDLLGQQQVVIKSLDRRFKGLPGISGGTILGDGRVGLILDVGSVVEYK
ncbi:MAG: chemotaxis protein CheA, partial [Nitrospinota bacterium]|nr:chemotaxis protein CheA [Nitrospinota bacterium]